MAVGHSCLMKMPSALFRERVRNIVRGKTLFEVKSWSRGERALKENRISQEETDGRMRVASPSSLSQRVATRRYKLGLRLKSEAGEKQSPLPEVPGPNTSFGPNRSRRSIVPQ